MRLIWHQFRCDVRANRLALGLWFLVLGMSLALNLGWIGSEEHHARTLLENNGRNFWGYAVAFAGWVLFFLLPALVVLANSPAKTDSFLDTRPMAKRDLYGAKVLLLVLLMAGPVVLQEWIYLQGSGLPGRVVTHGVLERLIWVLPLLGLSAGFSALWRNGREWTAALVSTLVGALLLGMIMTVITRVTASDEPGSRSSGNALVFLYVLAALMTTLAGLNHRFRWSVVKRAIGLVVILVLSVYSMALVPDFLPTKVRTAEAQISDLPFVVRPRDFQLSCSYKTNSTGNISVQANVTPRLDQLPPDVAIDWARQKAELVTDSGRMATDRLHLGLVQIFQYQYTVPGAEARALAQHLGPKAMLFVQPGFYQPEMSAGAGLFEVPEAFMAEKTTLKADFAGNVFRWEVAATLPMAAGQSVKDANGRWTILGAESGTPSSLAVALERDQITLNTSGDAATAGGMEAQFTTQFQFALYDEETGRAQFTDWQSYVNFTIGAETAYPRNFMEISFGANQSVSGMGAINKTNRIHVVIKRGRGEAAKSDRAGQLSLIILRKHYLGTVHKHWESPVITLGDYLNLSFQSNQMKNEQMPAAEFKERLAALTVPGPEASRMEVGLYLNDVLRLVEAHNEWLPENHPLISQLAGLVPKHLEVFIAGVPATGGRSHDVLLRAITRGAEEGQKGAIIAALPKAQDLTMVIVNRGWLKEAKAGLSQLFDKVGGMDDMAFRANAWFDDPATNAKLLEEFSARPEVNRYDVLRTVPGMATNLDQVVRDFYRRWPAVVDNIGQVTAPVAWQIGLRHGMPEALDEVYRLFELLPPAARRNEDMLLEVLKNGVEIPGASWENMNDHKWVAQWLAGHSAKDFQYDAARRRFVLKANARKDLGMLDGGKSAGMMVGKDSKDARDRKKPDNLKIEFQPRRAELELCAPMNINRLET